MSRILNIENMETYVIKSKKLIDANTMFRKIEKSRKRSLRLIRNRLYTKLDKNITEIIP